MKDVTTQKAIKGDNSWEIIHGR